MVATARDETSSSEDDIATAEGWSACDPLAAVRAEGIGCDAVTGAGGGGTGREGGTTLVGPAAAEDFGGRLPVSDMTEKTFVFDPQRVAW